MGSVVSIAERKPARTYTVHIEHHADGRISIAVPELKDNPVSRRTIAAILRRAAEEVENG